MDHVSTDQDMVSAILTATNCHINYIITGFKNNFASIDEISTDALEMVTNLITDHFVRLINVSLKLSGIQVHTRLPYLPRSKNKS